MKYYHAKLFLIILFFFGRSIHAQQMPFYNQYLHNQSLYNPAAGATKTYFNLKFLNRQQWSGWEGAPVSYYVAFSSPIQEKYRNFKVLPEKYHGLGAAIHYETAGIFQQSQIQLSYQYHLTLQKSLRNFLRFSLGISLNAHQIGFDQNKIRLSNPNDPLLAQGSKNSFTFDGNLGFWLYSKNAYLGFSVLNFAENRFDFGAENRLKRHYSLSTGYKLELNPDIWAFMPSAIVLLSDLKSVVVILNGLLRFEDKLWGGLGYANNRSLIFSLGFNLKQIADFTYSYETLSAQSTTLTSQEISLNFKLGNYRYRSRNKPEIPLFD